MSFAQPGAGGSSGPGFFSEFNSNQGNQGAGGYGKPNDPSDKWNRLQQQCFQSLTTISSESSQVKRMISKIGSYEDSMEFRAKMFVLCFVCERIMIYSFFS